MSKSASFKPIHGIAILILLVVGIALFKNRFRSGGAGTIAVRGGEPMEMRLPSLEHAYFSQRDVRWSEDNVGGTGERLRNVGCTICSVAMASTALGYEITPGELNKRLRDGGGYTDRGWLIWGAIPKATNGAVEAIVYDVPGFQRIDEALKRGDLPIVKFFLTGGIPHWVLVVGKSGTEYWVHDPSSSTAGPTKLSNRAKAIHSLRVIRKKALSA